MNEVTPAPVPSMQEKAQRFRDAYQRVQAEIGKVIVGHDEIVDGVLTCLFVGGHALLEGVPGPGQDAAGPHARPGARPEVQPHPVHARPDAGRHHRHQHHHRDARRPARSSASSRARSSPRSCWPTRSTAPRPRRSRPCSKRCRSTASPSAARSTRLKEPFFVMATQNPIEQEGTYPLPEAQLDRFFFKLIVNYSGREELATILDRTTPERMAAAEQGDGRRRDLAVAAARPRGAGRAARAGLRHPPGAGDAPAGRVRRRR